MLGGAFGMDGAVVMGVLPETIGGTLGVCTRVGSPGDDMRGVAGRQLPALKGEFDDNWCALDLTPLRGSISRAILEAPADRSHSGRVARRLARRAGVVGQSAPLNQ